MQTPIRSGLRRARRRCLIKKSCISPPSVAPIHSLVRAITLTHPARAGNPLQEVSKVPAVMRIEDDPFATSNWPAAHRG